MRRALPLVRRRIVGGLAKGRPLLAVSLALAACAGAPGSPADATDALVVDISPPAAARAVIDAGDAGADARIEEVSLEVLGLLSTDDALAAVLGDLDPPSGGMTGGVSGGVLGGLGAARPGVMLGMPIVVGGVSRDGVTAALFARGPELEACYALGLAKDATLGGSITLRLEVDAQGGVQSLTETGSTLKDPTVARCLLRAVSTVRFPATIAAPATITWPLFLRAPPVTQP